LQRHLVDSRSEEDSSGCRRKVNNKVTNRHFNEFIDIIVLYSLWWWYYNCSYRHRPGVLGGVEGRFRAVLLRTTQRCRNRRQGR